MKLEVRFSNGTTRFFDAYHYELEDSGVLKIRYTRTVVSGEKEAFFEFFSPNFWREVQVL
jgi:hypothetical protein